MADATATVAQAEIRTPATARAEPDVLKPLLERAALDRRVARAGRIGHALALLADLRAAQSRGWVNQFLQEYRLNSSEGVALL